jgi:cysteine desulfurase
MQKNNDPQNKMIYLDYQATTPLDPRVYQAMKPFFCDYFANPHSVSHDMGREMAHSIEQARARVARAIGARTNEIIFTSGATESNNMAIKGAALFRLQKEKRNRVIILKTEHACVIQSGKYLQKQGFDVIYADITKDGFADMEKLETVLNENTSLLCVMAAHNEIGVIQPIEALAEMAHKVGAWLHCDGSQAAGKIPVSVEKMNVDTLSISGHKIYASKGIGALYIRQRPRRIGIIPLIEGGGQEKGMRAGTLPTPLCVGLGYALEYAEKEREEEQKKIHELRQKFLTILKQSIPDVIINGAMNKRLAGNINLSFDGMTSERLIEKLPSIALSSASACAGGRDTSHVLQAMGVDEKRMQATLRIGFGRFTTDEEVCRAAEMISKSVLVLRKKNG